jgi:hypothetical protein
MTDAIQPEDKCAFHGCGKEKKDWRHRTSRGIAIGPLRSPTLMYHQFVAPVEPDDECGGEHCDVFPTKTLHHEGCDGAFCFHGICQECGSQLRAPVEESKSSNDALIAGLSGEAIAAIRKRLSDATPGPWQLGPIDENRVFGPGPQGLIIAEIEDATGDYNSEFIVHSRTDVALLLDAVERLQADLTQAQAVIAKVRRHCDVFKSASKTAECILAILDGSEK